MPDSLGSGQHEKLSLVYMGIPGPNQFAGLLILIIKIFSEKT